MRPICGILFRIIFPIATGFAVIYFMFGHELATMSLSEIDWTKTTTVGIIAALILLFLRQTGLAWRFRALTDNQLRWTSSYKVSLICDFTSAITPTSAGGSVLSMIFLNREGISLGRSTAITLITLFLDEVLFVVAVPLLMLCVPSEQLFAFADTATVKGLMSIFWVVYGVLGAFAVLLYIGIFHSPTTIARVLTKMFSLPLIRRWKPAVVKLGDNLVTTSKEIKRKKASWWIGPVSATILTWFSRFMIVNALFYAFFPESDQLTILVRQFIVWGILIFTPTPGGSGVSEMLFKTYYSDMVGGPMLAVLAIAWRIFTYYVYLFVGVLLIPSYLKLSRQSKSDFLENELS